MLFVPPLTRVGASLKIQLKFHVRKNILSALQVSNAAVVTLDARVGASLKIQLKIIFNFLSASKAAVIV